AMSLAVPNGTEAGAGSAHTARKTSEEHNMIARPLILAASLIASAAAAAFAAQIEIISPSVIAIGGLGTPPAPAHEATRAGYVPNFPLPPGQERPAPPRKV